MQCNALPLDRRQRIPRLVQEPGRFGARIGPRSDAWVEGYPFAFLRFAQDALVRLDMAFLAAALHGFRVRFCVALGFG